MPTSWNSNTIRAGKWMALTIGILVFFIVSFEIRDYIFPWGNSVFMAVGYVAIILSVIVAFVTTYYGVAAIRCQYATKKDIWVGITITLMAGAIGVISIKTMLNDLILL